MINITYRGFEIVQTGEESFEIYLKGYLVANRETEEECYNFVDLNKKEF